MSKITKAYKLVRLRKDGSIGPLFCNRRQRIETGKWLPAEDHPTKGFAHRPGWHLALVPEAPHLSERGRIWVEAEVKEYEEFHVPAHQGRTWLLANWMRILGPAAV